jgi:TonB family protein
MQGFTYKVECDGRRRIYMYALIIALGLFGATAGNADNKRRESDRPELYPREAYKQGIEGQATVECTITKTFRPGDCIVLSETPPGMGFGKAALIAVKRGRFDPTKPETIGTKYKATFRWDLPGE